MPSVMNEVPGQAMTMSDRVYILLDVNEWQTEQVVERLRSIDGVRIADLLEGNPNVIILLDAPDRQRLAEIAMQVISSEENVTQDLKLLPVCNESDIRITSVPACMGSQVA